MFHTLAGKEKPLDLIHHSAVILNPTPYVLSVFPFSTDTLSLILLANQDILQGYLAPQNQRIFCNNEPLGNSA